MSTVAEDLLNDFGSSGEEDVEEGNDGLNDVSNDATAKGNDGEARGDGGGGDADGMEVDGADADMEDAESAAAAQARIDKMQLGDVKDVRTVASLMQTLEPVLEVSNHAPSPIPFP